MHFKLVLGAKMMCISNKIINSAIRNNKEFGWIRRRAAESQSIRMIGENNPNFGGFTLEHCANISKSRLEGFANGSITPWNKGQEWSPAHREAIRIGKENGKKPNMKGRKSKRTII